MSIDRFKQRVNLDYVKRKQTHPNKQTVNAFVRFKEEGSALKAAEEA